MLILCWNCCLPPWSLNRIKRLPKIISAITTISPDIACLQEVFFKSDATSIVSGLSTYGFLDFFRFKDLLIISKTKLSGKKGGVFRKQGSIFSLAVLDVLYEKGFQTIKFLYNNKPIFLINTHLLSACADDSIKYQKVREEQIKEICKISEGLFGLEKIVLGDFNFQPLTSPYKVLIESGFIDTTAKENTTATRHLDFIFMKGAAISNAQIALFDNLLSDHAALAILL